MTLTESAERPARVALRAAWLFDGVHPTLQRDPVVVLEGATIRSVGTGLPPADLDVVDLGDATLLPGLIDTHVHLAFDASADPVGALAARDDAEVLTAMRAAGRTALAGGVTTVRDLGDRDYLSLTLRGAGDLPTLLAAGPPITTLDGHCHFLGGGIPPGTEEIRAAVRDHHERGVDVIKIMASGGQLTPGTQQHRPQFSLEELRAAVEEAHRLGLPVTAHAHATQGIRNAVDAGVDGVEHVSFWGEHEVDDPGELVALLAERRVVVGATVGVRPGPGAEPPSEVVRRMPAVFANGRRLWSAGVRFAAASDAGIGPGKPHDAVRYAVPQLMGIGMSAAQALMTLTSVAAEVLGLAGHKGRIAPGYDADLLAVADDPLSRPAALHEIRAVYCRGRAVRI